MFELLAAAVVLLIGVLLGAAWQMRVKRNSTPKHRHAFGEWQDIKVNEWSGRTLHCVVDADIKR